MLSGKVIAEPKELIRIVGNNGKTDIFFNLTDRGRRGRIKDAQIFQNHSNSVSY